MNRQDAFERILQSLHQAAFCDARWPAAAGLVDELVGAKGNCIVFGEGAAPDDIDLFFTRVSFRGERHRALEQEYFGVWHPFDRSLPRIRALPDSRLATVPSLLSEAERKSSAVYNELLPRARFRDGLVVRLDGPHRSRIVWAMGDPVDGEGWSPERVGAIERLLPHLRQFVRVRQALAGAGALGASLAGLLDNVRAGVVHLDRRGRPVAANDRARTLLRKGDGLRDEDGRLRAALPREDAALQKLLGRALPRPGGSGESGSIALTRPGTRSRLVLHASPVQDAGVETGRGFLGALVLAVDPVERADVDPAQVGKALGLTPAESRVAVALAEGRTVDGIAAATGRSRNTVRWHVRHIYAALGVSRQIELAQLVASLAALPGARA